MKIFILFAGLLLVWISILIYFVRNQARRMKRLEEIYAGLTGCDASQRQDGGQEVFYVSTQHREKDSTIGEHALRIRAEAAEKALAETRAELQRFKQYSDLVDQHSNLTPAQREEVADALAMYDLQMNPPRPTVQIMA